MKIIKLSLILLLVIAVVFLVLFFCVNLFVKASVSKYIISSDDAAKLDNVECIVALGAHVRNDGSPSLMLKSRLDACVELYNKGVSDVVLLSGDHGQREYDEVNNMMKYVLDSCSIEKDRVFLDHAGFSTYETACRARNIFMIDKAVFVTQKYHLYRTIYNARIKGIEAYGVACDDYQWPGIIYYKFRESLAVFKDFFYCLFNVSPTYLGEAIPVSGSAEITHDITE